MSCVTDNIYIGVLILMTATNHQYNYKTVILIERRMHKLQVQLLIVYIRVHVPLKSCTCKQVNTSTDCTDKSTYPT